MGYPITYYPPEARVLPLTLIRRERILPMPGRVIAVPGEHVQPTQIVAQTDATDDVRILNVARLLHVAPSKAHRYLKVKQGDDVHLGTLIAASGIFSANRLFSPVDGFIAKIDAEKGRVFIQAVTKPVELTAFLQGTIANVMGSRGVVIETTGAIVQANVGFGGESFGVLHVVYNEADDGLRAKWCGVASPRETVVGGGWIAVWAWAQA